MDETLRNALLAFKSAMSKIDPAELSVLIEEVNSLKTAPQDKKISIRKYLSINRPDILLNFNVLNAYTLSGLKVSISDDKKVFWAFNQHSYKFHISTHFSEKAIGFDETQDALAA